MLLFGTQQTNILQTHPIQVHDLLIPTIDKKNKKTKNKLITNNFDTIFSGNVNSCSQRKKFE